MYSTPPPPGLQCTSNPLKTVLRELNKGQLIEKSGYRAKRLLVATRIAVCLVVTMETLLSVA
jgi:hypothetical protein